ncbi:MAG: hypothetical protein II972_01835 [Elusimicrobiaceae bacterium]|nr:hypothetical protein [Elusimicrobiaceae bacterium]
MRKFLVLSSLIFLTLPGFCAENWAILKGNISANLILKELIQPKGRISYCIDGTQTQVIPDIEKTFQMWFDNVLSYRNVYPNFDETFKEILPILERKNKMFLQNCGSPFDFKETKNFLTQKKGYNFSLKRPILRISFCSQKECFPASDTLGSCQKENVPEKNIVISADSPHIVATLLHEFGHALSLGDVLYNQDLNDSKLGFNTTETFLVNSKYLTCDDADGIVALLYMGMGKEKTFHSFCGYVVFKQGENSHWESIKSSFNGEGKKYKVLQNLNRHFDAPLKEQENAFNERKLTYSLQQKAKK